LIYIKSAEEQELMRQGGRILAQILSSLKEKVKPGVSKKEIDNLANRLCLKYHVKPSFKEYNGFPGSVCVSINDAVVHGIPRDEPFVEGDLVTLDMGVELGGFHTDSAVTLICSNQGSDIQNPDTTSLNKLINTCEQSLYSGIDLIKDGIHLGDVSAKIQSVVEANGFGVVRMLVGHGIGKDVHEDPHIPNYGTKGSGPILKTGMTLAIEPMITQDGTVDVILDNDGWTYRSKSGALTAHAEHTVLVTDDGYEILTQSR
jgi:methionyl aminopeptidase